MTKLITFSGDLPRAEELLEYIVDKANRTEGRPNFHIETYTDEVHLWISSDSTEIDLANPDISIQA